MAEEEKKDGKAAAKKGAEEKVKEEPGKGAEEAVEKMSKDKVAGQKEAAEKAGGEPAAAAGAPKGKAAGGGTDEPKISFRDMNEREKRLAKWVPKTELGKKVLAGEVTDINEIFDQNITVLEPEIIDKLVELEEKIVDVKKTTRVIESGRRFSFRVTALVGNRNGLVGLGIAKDAEKWPAIRKAAKNAKMHLVRVKRGCGSWECVCGANHSVPFKVTGKCASVRVTFLPAPKGVGLVAGEAIKDLLAFAGIRDVWTRVKGATDTKLNFIGAAMDALSKTKSMKVSDNIGKKTERAV